MKRYLHDPIFAKKWWFLVLTVELKNGEEESGPVAFVKFNYVRDDHERRRRIEGEIVGALNRALARPSAKNDSFSARRGEPNAARYARVEFK